MEVATSSSAVIYVEVFAAKFDISQNLIQLLVDFTSWRNSGGQWEIDYLNNS